MILSMIDLGIKIKKFLLFIGDILLLYFSLWLTLLVRYGTAKTFIYHIMPFSVVYFIFVTSFYVDGLYDFDFRKNRIDILNKLTRSLSISAVIAITFFYFAYNKLFTIKPQRVFLINLFIIFILLFLWRYFFYFFIKSQKFTKNLLIIGDDQFTHEIVKKLISRPQLGFTIKAILASSDDNEMMKLTEKNNIKIFSDKNSMKSISQEANIHSIVFSDSLKEDQDVLKNLIACLSLNVTYYELSSFYEKIMGKIPVDYIGQVWFLENLQEGSKKIYEIVKRFFDILISLLLLILSSPLIPFIVIAIKIDSKGSILFKQFRVGKNGKRFLAMKFRSMYTDSEKTGPQWAQKEDPRVTRIGRLMRKTRLDEIPQLINVLRGEMSLIGPRPERPEFVEQLKAQIPFYEERLLVKPGLTGWAQVMGPSYGGSLEETLEKIQYDLYYIKNRSLGLDVSILLKTIKTVLSRKGQ